MQDIKKVYCNNCIVLVKNFTKGTDKEIGKSLGAILEGEWLDW